jgi:hypothetical protein
VVRALYVCALLCLMVATVSASDPEIDLGSQAKGAKKIVVATVTDVQSSFGVNDHGDQLILSRVSLKVDETMKGPHEATVVVTLEGGTLGDLTLSVSDMPEMKKGERAVFFLDDSPRNGRVPHRRGASVMKLNQDNRVEGTDLTIDDIRAAVKAAQRQGN